MEYYRTEWPNGSIPPKLHMLEDHATDFVEKWKTGFGMYGEQGGESIHNEFNEFKTHITGCSLLQNVLAVASIQKAKQSAVVKLKNKFCRKRKTTL